MVLLPRESGSKKNMRERVKEKEILISNISLVGCKSQVQFTEGYF